MMRVIPGDGTTLSPLFLFKGKSLPYRSMQRDGEVFVETYGDLLPKGNVVSMREGGGSVDSDNFFA